MKRYCLTLDLKDDDALIAEYDRRHENVPAAIEQSILDSGITAMQIYRLGTRMFMIIETADGFDFARKAQMDAANPHVQAWEDMMWKLQQPLPQAKDGERGLLMKPVFDL